MRLGVCYYPEHWPEDQWAADARQMVELGLSLVRVGEFAWSRFEPEPGHYDWAWFDRVIDTFHQAGLTLILGTPTATPPKWLIDQHPDILAQDAQGKVRGFGSRRHYCFSSPIYRDCCRKIVTEMAKRYGEHPAIVMWQTDNEYGCHNTVESYSLCALKAFRLWLKERYGSIKTLNSAWGTVFWSQTYRNFDEIEFPVQTVTEANPSHRLDFQRFCSDQVVLFNQEQVELIRQYSPGRDITHNFMGWSTDFDHHDAGKDIDIASWDSYPLGFLNLMSIPETQKQHWLRQGHPDFQAFHHDLYRGCSPKWGVMEQQPGPVNWAPYNPAPLMGMVRLWSMEAIAHGADLVSWFRWRQVPFAQEHMHAGLNCADGRPAPAYEEVRQVFQDIQHLQTEQTQPAKIALIFDYPGQWIHNIQPQGQGLDLFRQAFEAYSALRQLGFNIDILPQIANLQNYSLVVLPGNPFLPNTLIDQLSKFEGQVLALPRTGAKTETFQIPDGLAPGRLRDLIDMKVERVESLRPSICETARYEGLTLTIHNWREHVLTSAKIHAKYDDLSAFWVSEGSMHYLAGWPDIESLKRILVEISAQADLKPIDTGSDLRLRSLGKVQFAFNYGPDLLDIDHIIPTGAQFMIGESKLMPAAFAAWRI